MTDLAIDPIFTDAVIFASLLALLSIGLTLTYLTTRVPNFAHASFATIGVYIALITSRVWETSPYFAIPIAFVISGVVAVALYTFILKPLIRKGASENIGSMAKSVVFQYRKPLISLRLCAFDERSIDSGS